MIKKLLILTICVISFPVLACLWDYDTITMERSRFPSALELMALLIKNSLQFTIPLQHQQFDGIK